MSVTLVGKENLLAQIRDLPATFKGATVRRGVRAAAEVYRAGIERSAPHGPVTQRKNPHYPIASNVAMKEIKNPDTLYKSEEGLATTILVGPTKKAFQAWFIEKGWHAMGRAGRKGRKATKTTHSQRGVSGGHFITGIHFVEKVGIFLRSTANDAAMTVYRQALAAYNQKWGVKNG